MTISLMDKMLAACCESQFSQIGWTKPEGYFYDCLSQQDAGTVTAFVAHEGDRYMGHVKLVRQSDYPAFRDNGIPEIQDLNVLPEYRRKGIGTALISRCELLAGEESTAIGIGVGLHPGYNHAQRLYPRLGYLIDGRGVHYDNVPVEEGKTYPFDDALTIYFTKILTTK